MSTSRRDQPSPALLVDFWWTRLMRARWVDQGTERVLAGVHGDWYEPLKSGRPLYRAFAALEDTEQAFADFASEYGAYHQGEPEEPSPLGYPVTPHTFEEWRRERQTLALAVRMWEALTCDRPDDVLGTDVRAMPYMDRLAVQFGPPQRHGRIALPEGIVGPFVTTDPRKSDSRSIVQVALAALATRESGASVALAVSPTRPLGPGDAGLRLTYGVSDLRSAFWLQLALDIDGNRRYETCSECGNQWDATGARSDKKTCSDRCRQARKVRLASVSEAEETIKKSTRKTRGR